MLPPRAVEAWHPRRGYNGRMSRFNLPVLGAGAKPATSEQLVARSLHAEAIYDGALGETVHLDLGTAIISPDLAEVDMGNEMRDVQAPADGASVDEAIAGVERTFSERKARCLAWSFAGGVLDEAVAVALEKRGYHRHLTEVWSLKAPRTERARRDLTIIPGRASYGKIQELFRATGAAQHESAARAAQYTQAAVRCLDDSRVDAILALDGQSPVGVAYLVTAGEAGFIADLYVHPARQREKIGTTLVERVVELATRSRHRSLTLFCRPGNVAARGLYVATGWEIVGQTQTLRWPQDSPA